MNLTSCCHKQFDTFYRGLLQAISLYTHAQIRRNRVGVPQGGVLQAGRSSSKLSTLVRTRKVCTLILILYVSRLYVKCHCGFQALNKTKRDSPRFTVSAPQGLGFCAPPNLPLPRSPTAGTTPALRCQGGGGQRAATGAERQPRADRSGQERGGAAGDAGAGPQDGREGSE